MSIARRLLALGFAFGLAACGGKVVFVAESDGGAGGGQSSSSSSSGGDCTALTADLEAKTAAAQACSPMLQQIQCNGTVMMSDECGCPRLVLNETQPALVSSAETAYTSWTGAGCGPHACQTPCGILNNGTCQPSADFTTGTCIAVGIK